MEAALADPAPAAPASNFPSPVAPAARRVRTTTTTTEVAAVVELPTTERDPAAAAKVVAPAAAAGRVVTVAQVEVLQPAIRAASRDHQAPIRAAGVAGDPPEISTTTTL
jgi:hypothetical protein